MYRYDINIKLFRIEKQKRLTKNLVLGRRKENEMVMMKTKVKREILQTGLFNIFYRYQMRGFLRPPSKIKFE